jgi:arsenate reductase
MQEAGIDISEQRSKHFNEYLKQPFDYVITVCDNAAETCPLFPGKAQRIHWSFVDPAAIEGTEQDKLTKFREVRNQIQAQMQHWVRDLS